MSTWQIVINGPGYFDTAYDLPDGITTLGRAEENDIVLSGDLVSRKHASLQVKGDQLLFEDLGSRNGCRVNGEGVTAARAVNAGDTLTVGENTLVVRRPMPGERVLSRAATEPTLPTAASGDQADVRSAIILSKAVSESFVLRALDNVFPFRPGETAAPQKPLGEPQGESGAKMAYEAVLLVCRVAELLATAPTLKVFLERTIDWLMAELHASTAVVLALDPAGALLKPMEVRHHGQLAEGEVPVSDAIVAEALTQKRALVVADVKGDQRFNRRESVVLYGVGQVFCIPLGHQEPYAGVLYLNRAMGPREGLEAALDLCTVIGHLVATALEKFASRHSPNTRLRSALERALPPELAQRRLSEQGTSFTQLQPAEATVLFADLSGFSGLVRKGNAPVLASVLQQFYQVISRVVFSFQGTVVTFVGDSALTVFGAPYRLGDDAARAVRTALSLRTEWQRLNRRRPTAEQCPIKVGIHTGAVLGGTVATDQRLDYVVVGDPVNTAAWLVGLAGPDQILMTGQALTAAGSRFQVSTIGERPVGGREKLVLYDVQSDDLSQTTLGG